MKSPKNMVLIVVLALACFAFSGSVRAEDEPTYTDTFRMDRCRLAARGWNEYFPLVPGYSLLLEGEDEGESVRALITVLRRTMVVDGVRCRVVREMEWVDGELVEISWNYFAICRNYKDIFYFGEHVDIYEDGEVVSHEGEWLSGLDGAEFGLMMPGYPLVGSRYYQEIAPGVAMDRGENMSVTTTVVTPAGTFENCLIVKDTSPLDPEAEDIKAYAPGIGLVQDETLRLVAYGFRIGRHLTADDADDEDGDDDDDDDDDE